MGQFQNCWEFKKCGREPGGEKASELGVCPATKDASFHSLNDGEKGGRICWDVVGTLCGGQVQGSFAQKRHSCLSCEFFTKVKHEEGLVKFIMHKN